MSYIFKINTLDLNVLSTGKSTFYASCEVCRAVLKLMVIFCTRCTANICHTTLCTSTAYAVLWRLSVRLGGLLPRLCIVSNWLKTRP